MFDIKLMRSRSTYGEYESLDFKNTLAILKECIKFKNTAVIKFKNKDNKVIQAYTIQNNEHLKKFIKEVL